MSTLTFSTAALSRPGGRECNEDACGYRDGAWALADGLGGHGGGEVASRLAVDAALAALAGTAPVTAALESAIAAADAAVRAPQQTEAALARMRTTLVLLLSDGETALWAHVGDSRLYHFRAGRLLHQTLDHSVPQALVHAGELAPADIRHHEDRNRLLRSLGEEGAARPSLPPAPVPLAAGDAFLLCTDGFWEYVTETEMEIALAQSADPAAWLAAMTVRLLARAAPDHDNFSALALFAAAPATALAA